MRPRIREAAILSCLIPALLSLSCGGGAAEPPRERGSLVSIRRTATVSAAAISSAIAPYDAEAARLAVHDVTTYTLVYITRDPHDDLVRASGALFVPSIPVSAPWVSIQHGTVTLRTDVASVSPVATTEGLCGLLLASTGYIVSLPDYQGYGVSTAFHPYHHATSLAAAVVDLLVAAEEAAPAVGARPDGRLFLAGYSEGGYATLATHREIERNHSDRFHLVASAPMAGVYDVSGTARGLFAAQTYRWPAYLAFILTAYDEIYGWHRLGEIFQAPYAGMMRGLFDGTRDFGSINQQLPTTVSDLLQEGFVRGFLDGSDLELVQALRENDLLDWIPAAPIRFYHGNADDTAPYQNALTALERLSSPSNSVELVTIDGGTHETAGLPALLDMVRWLDGQ